MWFDYISKLLWQCSVASQNSAWVEGIEPQWGNRNCDRGKYKNWDTKVIFPILQFLLTWSSLYYLCSSCVSDWPHSLNLCNQTHRNYRTVNLDQLLATLKVETAYSSELLVSLPRRLQCDQLPTWECKNLYPSFLFNILRIFCHVV